MDSRQRGFTIVELLIVIVVIGILAAISIVAYTSVSAQASDVAVKSDIRNFAMKVREQQVYDGSYPLPTHPTTGVVGNGQPPKGLDGFRLTEGVYDMSSDNIYYCVGNIDGVQHFAIAAQSRSGKRWIHHSLTGSGEYPGTSWTGVGPICNTTLGFGQDGETRWFTTAIKKPAEGETEGKWAVWVNKK